MWFASSKLHNTMELRAQQQRKATVTQPLMSCETSLKKWKLKMWKRSFRARLPSKSESGRCENKAFVQDFPQKLKGENVKRSFHARLSSKTERWKCENESFVQDFPQKVKVVDHHCGDNHCCWASLLLTFTAVTIIAASHHCCSPSLLWRSSLLTIIAVGKTLLFTRVHHHCCWLSLLLTFTAVDHHCCDFWISVKGKHRRIELPLTSQNWQVPYHSWGFQVWPTRSKGSQARNQDPKNWIIE